MVDVERAEAYIRQHGDEFDQERLNTLLGEGPVLSREQNRRFLAGQRADGGWAPFWAPEYSSLDATCYRLWQCDGIIGLLEPAFARAVSFLRSRQGADGSWEEDERVRDVAPPWARPGELASQLYLTANCGWSVANASLTSSFVTTDEAAIRAGAYLEPHLAQDGTLPSFLQTHWLAAGLWIRLDREDLAYRALDHLATRMSDDVPASSLAWMLTTLAGLGISPDLPFALKAIMLLMSQQRADGSWASEDGAERDPYVTMEALRGLILWAAI